MNSRSFNDLLISTNIPCTRTGCSKRASTLLRIAFTKKAGYFCDSCAFELKELGLASEEANKFDGCTN
jgi:hypothetical protein